MNYKNSLLIYKAQTNNVSEIWDSKSRLIKNLTPLLRSFREEELNSLDTFRNDYKDLVNNTNQEIETFNLQKSREQNPTIKEGINNQITDLKLQYLESSAILKKQLKNHKIKELEFQTKTLVILYCTWSEAVFKKLIHTPYGLNISNRSEIYGSSIGDKWENLIDKILNVIPIQNNQDDIDQMKDELKQISNDYIIEPSKLRNKIAHGQWSEALDNANTKLVIPTSLKLSLLDIVELNVSFDIHHKFVNILENILESTAPDDMIMNKPNSYLYLKNELDVFISSRNNWNLKSRITFLKQRTFDTRNLSFAKEMNSHNINKDIIYSITSVRLK